jgi:hypothetical protein
MYEGTYSDEVHCAVIETNTRRLNLFGPVLWVLGQIEGLSNRMRSDRDAFAEMSRLNAILRSHSSTLIELDSGCWIDFFSARRMSGSQVAEFGEFVLGPVLI